jgi:hypothetical protein
MKLSKRRTEALYTELHEAVIFLRMRMRMRHDITAEADLEIARFKLALWPRLLAILESDMRNKPAIRAVGE